MPDPQRTALLEEARFQLQHLDRALSYQLVGFPLTISLQREGIQQVADLLRGLLALVDEPRDWHPIETAPKDGRKFLVFWLNSLMGDPEIDMVTGWREYQEILELGEPPATHWSPVPAPPVSGAEPRATAPRRDEEHE